VLGRRDSGTLEVWGALRHEAKVLSGHLLQTTWQDILDHSTLGSVFKA
jgi:hypothetical protein